MKKTRLGLEYPKDYECSFLATGGNIFNLAEIQHCVSSSDYNPDSPEFLHSLQYPKAMGIIPGYVL